MVVKQVKQWLQTRANVARWRAIQEWAEARRAEFQVVDDGAGFQIEQGKSRSGGGLRIEWGPSQRDYIPGHELRMRFEAGLHSELQTMALDRELMEALESTVFEAYTDTLKTRVDTDTPEEMRWLVMFSKCMPAQWPALREHMGFIGVHKDMAAAWVEGELGQTLSQLATSVLKPGRPFVLMCMRGNVYLRVSMDDPDLAELQGLVKLLEVAAREGQRVSGRLSELGQWPTTTAATFQPTRPG
jgi:hypothetical protein